MAGPYVVAEDVFGAVHVPRYLRTRAALARVKSGVGSRTGGVITETGCGLFIATGDSNTRGTGSASVVATQGYNGWPVKLAAFLRARGINASCDNFFGAGGYEGALATNDNRLAISGGVTNPLILSAGGRLFSFASAGTLTFTPYSQCNKLDVYYVQAASNGTISYAVDGGAPVNIVTGVAASTTMKKLTIDLGSVGAHSIVFSWVSGTSYLHGADAYDSTSPRIHIMNMGWHGSRTAMWTTDQTGSSVFTAPNVIRDFYKPDLMIGPALGTNDQSVTNAVPSATFKTNQQTLISAWDDNSDILLLNCGPRGDAGRPSESVIADYNVAMRELSNENGIALLDEFSWMGGDEAVAKALGLFASDDLHKSGAGHQVTANMIGGAVLALA